MFLKCSERRKNGKVHRSWSVVESRRFPGGKVAQQHVLYRLDRDKLLNNVANTLGHWDAAAGLCAALHRHDDYFWISAEAHKPEDFAGQYRDRLKFIRERGLPAFAARFENMELRLRRLIDATTLALPAPAT